MEPMRMTQGQYLHWFRMNGIIVEMFEDEINEVHRMSWCSRGGRRFQSLGGTYNMMLYNMFYQVREILWEILK